MLQTSAPVRHERRILFPKGSVLALIIGVVLGCGDSARATLITWAGGPSGNWNVGSNWGGTVASGTTNVAQINAAATNVNTTLDTPITIGGLQTGTSATTSVWTISASGGNAFTLDGTSLSSSTTSGNAFGIAGEAVIAARGVGTAGSLSVAPDISFGVTALGIGATNTSSVTVGGNITATASQSLFFRGGNTGTATINGNIGASGSSIALSNLRSSSGGVVINGILGPSVASVAQSGAGGMTLTGANTYTGATSITAGTLTVNGANGAIANSSGYTVTGGSLAVDDTAGAGNLNRLKNSGNVTLSLAGTFALTGNASMNTMEQIGTLGIDPGPSTITIANGTTARVTTLAASGFLRTGASTAVIAGTNLGQNQTGDPNYSALTLTSTAGLTQVGSTTSNSGVSTGTDKALTIIPYLVGNTTVPVTTGGYGFLTYDTVSGLRVLGATEYGSLTGAYTTAGNPENVTLGASVSTTSAITINSLLVTAGPTNHLGSGGSLTINSGLIVTRAPTTSIGGYSSIILGNGTWNEGIVGNFTGSSPLTIASPVNVTGGGGLTKVGGQSVILTANNLYTGPTTVNGGTLTIGNGTSGALASTATITVNTGGTALAVNLPDGSTLSNEIVTNGSSGLTLLIASGTQTLSGNISGSGSISQAMAGTTIFSGDISTGGTVTLSGGGTMILSGDNTYGGQTSLSSGTLQGSDSTVYTGATNTLKKSFSTAQINISNGTTLQLRANGNNNGTAQTFNYPNLLQVSGASTSFTVDVDRQAATGGTNKTIAMGNLNMAANPTVNVTGANGFGFAISQLMIGGSGTASTVVLNPTTASLTIASVGGGSNTASPTLNLDGTATGNSITGIIANNSSGITAVTKSNNSTWTLEGANSYTGATTISGGTLIVSGSIAGSATATSVGSFGTLGGAGTLNPAVSVLGVLAPGNSSASIGKLTAASTNSTAALDFSGGGTYLWELGSLKDNATGSAGMDFDQIALTGSAGNLKLGGTSKLTLGFDNGIATPGSADPFWTANHTWTIIAGSAGVTNTGSTNFGSIINPTFATGRFSTASDGGGNVTLNFSVVPEPGIASALLGGIGMLLGLQRFRRRRA